MRANESLAARNARIDDNPASNPSVVVFPTSTEDVVKIVKVSGKYKMPVIPVSGATSLEGHYRAVRFRFG